MVSSGPAVCERVQAIRLLFFSARVIFAGVAGTHAASLVQVPFSRQAGPMLSGSAAQCTRPTRVGHPQKRLANPLDLLSLYALGSSKRLFIVFNRINGLRSAAPGLEPRMSLRDTFASSLVGVVPRITRKRPGWVALDCQLPVPSSSWYRLGVGDCIGQGSSKPSSTGWSQGDRCRDIHPLKKLLHARMAGRLLCGQS